MTSRGILFTNTFPIFIQFNHNLPPLLSGKKVWVWRELYSLQGPYSSRFILTQTQLISSQFWGNHTWVNTRFNVLVLLQWAILVFWCSVFILIFSMFLELGPYGTPDICSPSPVTVILFPASGSKFLMLQILNNLPQWTLDQALISVKCYSPYVEKEWRTVQVWEWRLSSSKLPQWSWCCSVNAIKALYIVMTMSVSSDIFHFKGLHHHSFGTSADIHSYALLFFKLKNSGGRCTIT